MGMSRLARPLAMLAAGTITASVFIAACTAPGASPRSAEPAPAAPGAPSPQTGPTERPPRVVRAGTLATVGDAGWWVAIHRGYFQELGIDFQYTTFNSAADMVAPLSAGQLDVGGGAISAGLFNAIARGVELKAVADKSSSPPGHSTVGIVIRKDLWESGRVRSPADLKGLRLAISGRGIAPETEVNAFLGRGGLSFKDLDVTTMSFSDTVVALANQSIDLTVIPEPFLTQIRSQDLGHIWVRSDEMLPGHITAVVLYSPQFIAEQPDTARDLMVGYLRAVRDYNDAFFKQDPAAKQMVVEALTRFTPLKNPALYDEMVVQGLDPNGEVPLESLEKDQEYFLAAGLQQQRIDLSKVVDNSFARAAVQILGPYR
jgi:NitT/TauT family transport system substrate-binding protein